MFIHSGIFIYIYKYIYIFISIYSRYIFIIYQYKAMEEVIIIIIIIIFIRLSSIRAGILANRCAGIQQARLSKAIAAPPSRGVWNHQLGTIYYLFNYFPQCMVYIVIYKCYIYIHIYGVSLSTIWLHV